MKFLKITKKINKQKKKTELFLEWLQENVGYLPPDGDRAFLMHQRILWFRETLENARQDDPATHLRFCGMDWILRLIHCLLVTDDDDVRFENNSGLVKYVCEFQLFCKNVRLSLRVPCTCTQDAIKRMNESVHLSCQHIFDIILMIFCSIAELTYSKTFFTIFSSRHALPLMLPL